MAEYSSNGKDNDSKNGKSSTASKPRATRYSMEPPSPPSGLERYNLSDLWTAQYERFRKSRERISKAGELRRGEVRPHVPQDIEQSDAFRITIPHGTLMVQNIIQYGARKTPGIRRASGPGPQATRLASKIEKWLGAPGKAGALNELKSNGEVLWESFWAHAANDGEYGVLVLPCPPPGRTCCNSPSPIPSRPTARWCTRTSSATATAKIPATTCTSWTATSS